MRTRHGKALQFSARAVLVMSVLLLVCCIAVTATPEVVLATQ